MEDKENGQCKKIQYDFQKKMDTVDLIYSHKYI